MFKGQEFDKALEIAKVISECCADESEVDWLLNEAKEILKLKFMLTSLSE